MSQVLLFRVAPETAGWLRSVAGTVDGFVSRECETEEAITAALSAEHAGESDAIDAVVIGASAENPVLLAERLRARDQDVSILWLSPTDEDGSAPDAKFWAAGDVLLRRLRAREWSELVAALGQCVAASKSRRATRRVAPNAIEPLGEQMNARDRAKLDSELARERSEAQGAELEKLRASLERANAERDALLSIIAHDMRAPLGVILGAMNELAHPSVGALNDEQRTLVSLMKRSCDRLGRMATNVAHVSKLLGDRADLSKKRVDFVAFVRAQVKAFQSNPDLSKARIHLQLPETKLDAQIDEERFGLAITNLLANAIRYAKANVNVRVVPSGKTANLEIEDDGSGIPPKSGDLFDRLSTSRAGKSGSGLGLAIVRGVAHAHGGSARAENWQDEGSTVIRGARFIVSVPIDTA